MRRICRRFNVDEILTEKGLSDLLIMFQKFEVPLRTISTLPFSTAEYEPEFSLMNNRVTDLRAYLLTSNVFGLMFLNSNGPSLNSFNQKSTYRP
jgi:hypothetical protein